MKLDPFLEIGRIQPGGSRSEEIRKEEAAVAFEEIFARHLVGELTKDSFKMSDNSTGMGSTSHLYREFITDALAGELAAQKTLGMADLVNKYWEQTQPALSDGSDN